MIRTKIQVNWPVRSGGEGKNKHSRWLPCGHLGFPIRTILAIFDLQVTPMLPTKFQVSWPFDSGEEVKNRFFKMATMAAILDFLTGKILSFFFIYRSPRCFLLSFKSTGLSFKRRSNRQIFKMTTMAAILNF